MQIFRVCSLKLQFCQSRFTKVNSFHFKTSALGACISFCIFHLVQSLDAVKTFFGILNFIKHNFWEGSLIAWGQIEVLRLCSFRKSYLRRAFWCNQLLQRIVQNSKFWGKRAMKFMKKRDMKLLRIATRVFCCDGELKIKFQLVWLFATIYCLKILSYS